MDEKTDATRVAVELLTLWIHGEDRERAAVDISSRIGGGKPVGEAYQDAVKAVVGLLNMSTYLAVRAAQSEGGPGSHDELVERASRIISQISLNLPE